MVRLQGIGVAVVLWLAVAASPVAGQYTGPDIPKTRAEFERLLLERANPDSLATDGAGAYNNIYLYLVPARFLDRRLYEQALQQLAGGHGTGCLATGDPRSRMACVANNAASTLSLMQLFAEATLLRRDAIAFAETVADSDPARLLDALVALALDEWSHGSMMEAEAAVRRVSALLASRPQAATYERSMVLSVLKARLADAHLDDAAAVAALAEAVNAQLSKGTHRERVDGYLSDLFTQHLRGRFCPNCGRPVAEPMQRWLNLTLQRDLRADFGSSDEKTPDRAGLLLKMLTAPQGTVPPASLQTYARKYVAAAKQQHVSGVRRLLPPGSDDVTTARMLLVSYLLEGDSLFRAEQPLLTFLRERHLRRQTILMREHLESVAADNYSQFGTESDLPAAYEEAAWRYEQAGFPRAARLTLEFLIDWQTKLSFSVTDEQVLVKDATIRQARVFVPALARLAALQLSAGDRAAAERSLDDASAIAQAKLRAEWEQGGERAILAMRDLSQGLGLIARARHNMLAPRGLADNPSGADALFREMQAAITGETALTLEIARQRRILNTPQLAGLRRAHLRALADAAHLADVAGRYAQFDYDNAISAARREADSSRDRAAADLGTIPRSIAAADIQPVTLAEARTSLGDGEALVLLRAGGDSLDGFLLERDGKTSIWRSHIPRDELEALVKSLRSGADMATSKIPDFKFDDAVRLHELIFGPVKARLASVRKLIVLGDGPLQSLPYGILLTRKPTQAPRSAMEFRAAALPWLARSHAVALVPSVRSLATQRSGAMASRAERPFLGIGNPQLADVGAGARSIDVTSVFNASSGGIADVTVLRRLASLPETEDELRQIGSVLKANEEDIIVGRAANEAAVKTLQLDQYRMIAFATHGALAGELAGTSEPGLVLTPPAKASPEDDGFLSLSEIAGLKLDADLIILSACNTGTSDGRPRAESLSGLARGFFSAGARSLLVTHWTIPSDSAVRSTTGLVTARSRDPRMDWADALREATLAIIDKEGPPEWAHPSFWGAYVAIGVLPLQ